MQRQSLGSPGRERLVISSDDAVFMSDDQKRRESSPSSFSAADLAASAATDADEIKPEKPHHHHRCRTQPEKFIHLIPVLIVFCFVVLYLSSHDPSPQDLAEFRGFHYKQPEDIIEVNVIDEIGRIDEKKGKDQLKRSEAFVIRSMRNLQEEIVIQRDTPPKYQTHRKLGDF